MAKQRNLQLFRGTAAQNNLTTGLNGELTYDTTNKKIRVHDGATEGGFSIPKDSEVVHVTGTESIAGGKTFTDNIYAPTAAPGTNTTQVATTAFVQAAGSLQLGETETTAYRGDRGKTAYDHSQLITGNPHNVTASDVGLGNVDNTSDADKPISDDTQDALDVFSNINTITKEPTGFQYPADVIVTYDSTTRKVTLTGDTTAYFRGSLVSVLTSGWVSDAHPDTVGVYFLYYDGTSFSWGTSFSDFSLLQIAVAYYRATTPFGTRECHGFLQHQAHQEAHWNIGTYRTAGGDISNVVLLSTTADNRRPIISACTIWDEDNPTTNVELTSKKYSVRYLTSADTINYNLQADDIVPLSGDNPYYNSFSSPNYGQTLMPDNSMMTVWLYEVPVSSDAASQEIRHVFVQGQSITQAANISPAALTAAYNTELAKNSSELNLGVPSVVSAEYVAIQKFIIQYTGGNWSIRGSIKLTGSRASQVSSPSGSYLSSVSTDATLTGSGTPTDPLSVVGGGGTNVYPQNYVSNSYLDYHSTLKDFVFFDFAGYSVGDYNSSTTGYSFDGTNTKSFIALTKMFNPSSNPWELTCAITPPNFSAKRAIMSGYNNNNDNYLGFLVAFNTTGKLLIYLGSTGAAFNLANGVAGTLTYTAGTKYWIKLEYSGTTYKIYYSTDGVNFTEDYSLTSSTPLYQGIEGIKIRFGLSAIADFATLGTVFLDSISYKISTVEQLSTWSHNKACSLVFSNYSTRGVLNTNDINTAAMTKLINTAWAAGTGAGAFVSYSTYTEFSTSEKYSLFMVTNGTLNDIVAISSTAHTDGILVAGAITAINTALSTTITDYRYIGECQANKYTTPYLDKYIKQYNGDAYGESFSGDACYVLRGSDNFITQFGTWYGSFYASTTITFKVPFKNNNYHQTTSAYGNYSSATSSSHNYTFAFGGVITGKYNSYMTYNQTDSAVITLSWEAKGYAV